jgi:arabinan endo-1,5-alpha-L-arabinosidase
VATGGVAPASGGTPGTGGKATGGNPAGGAPTGGKATGGTATGGVPTGGKASGGTATGGAATGDRCDVGVYNSSSPPQALTLSGNLGAHDPSALLVNGTYYEFQTGLGSKTSTNVTSWTGGSRPFTAPAWATSAVPGVTDLWAPDISYFGGQYHLYYSASTFGSNRSCIGHATRASMTSGSWTDQGSATICSNVNTSDNWNAIDPAVELDTSGTPYLVFGSFWSGIKLIQLDQNGQRVGTTVTAIANRPSNGGAVEGPYIVRRCGYYYLFTSWDKCCDGANSTYNIRVARATSITGPYADKAGTASSQGGGTLIAQGNSTWAGPGGQSVFLSGTKAYLIYHAYAKSNGAATLRISDLVWDSSGWPVPVGP